MARPRLGRAVAALTSVSVAMLVAALPASAEDPTTATFLDKHEDGLDVALLIEDEKDPEKFPTRLSDIQIKDGPTVKTYGFIPLAELKKDTELIELPWPSDEDPTTTIKTLKMSKLAADDTFKKLNWVLRHSYPAVTVDSLKHTLSLDGLNNKEAIAATQAAIWQLLFGGFELADSNNAHVQKLYKYLVGDKNTGSVNDEAPELEVDPATLSGKAGDRLGPVKVKTNAKELALSLPEGVKLTDKDGKELAAKDVQDGVELFFQTPAGAAGQGTVEIKAGAATVRLFAGGGDPDKAPAPQLKAATTGEGEGPDFQFLAFAQDISKTAKVTVSWTASETAPAPQPSNGGLANTGVSIYVPLGIAVLLLLAGGGALLYLRRRRA